MNLEMKSRKNNILLEIELDRIIISVCVWGVKYVGCVVWVVEIKSRALFTRGGSSTTE